jgi:hypothetical protein
MKSRWIFVLGVTLLWAAAVARPIAAQDTPAPADETEAAQAAESVEGEADQKKIKNGLYVEVGYGGSDMDPLDTTTRSSSTQSSSNSLTLDGMDYARAAIGWQLPGPKGRFRLVWEGYNENGYQFSATGMEASLATQNPPPIAENLRWWQLNAVDGNLTAERTPPTWTLADDDPANGGNNDGVIQQNEVTYAGVDQSHNSTIAADLQNRVQTVDALFGREWGPRRIEGRWFGGLRYFAYEGTLLQGAWLRAPMADGAGFTDGLAIRLLHPTQKSSGIGPTGSLGFQVNFFDRRVQLFMNGQFAFLLSEVKTDTGDFFTVTNGNQNDEIVTARARLTAERSRTSWQTSLEAGARLNLKLGLTIELAYFKTGFLDAVLTPTDLRIPLSLQEVGQGTSALFATQDLVLDGIRGSVAFQF